jgi:adenylate cyclase class 2
MQEIEAKYRLHDPQALRARLTTAGWTCCDEAIERNVFLDDDAGSLRKSDRALRIRTRSSLADAAKQTYLLTYKGPAATGAVKSREEHELTISDSAELLEVLAGLGYRPRLSFEKHRETWRIDGRPAEVVLDELPQLGWFVEIEADSAEAVLSIAHSLGLKPEDAEPATYTKLVSQFPASTTPTGLRFGAK